MASVAISDAARTLSPREDIECWYASLAQKSDEDLLGVPAGADRARLRAAYLVVARRFHPDALAAANADLRDKQAAVFIRVTQAMHNLGGDRPVRASAAREPQPPAAVRPAAVSSTATGPALSAPAAAEPRAIQPTAATSSVAAAPRRMPAPEPALVEKALPVGERIERVIEEVEQMLARRQTDAAVGALHGVVSLAQGPQQRRIRLLLARTYIADARWRRDGISLLRALVQEDPTNADALCELGRLYFAEDLPARAETTLEQALANDPGHRGARAAMREVRAALLSRRESLSPGRGPGLVSWLTPFRR